MKKSVSFLCILALMFSLCGCVSLLGGVNRREIGEYTYLFTDGDKQYLKYYGMYEDGYAVIADDSFTLYEGVLPDTVISPQTTEAEIVLTAYISALSDGSQCAVGYGYLSEQLENIFGTLEDEKYYEALLLKKGEEIYGAVNCYSRPSGGSGNLLTNENLEKSCLVSCQDGVLAVDKEYEGTAIMAFNQTHFIAYKNQSLYSVNIESDEEVKICDDFWWDKGPTYYNDFSVRFTDDYFIIYATNSKTFSDKATLIAGKMDGSFTETLIDNEKV